MSIVKASTGVGASPFALYDVWNQVGLEGMAQVELGTKRNAHQSLAALSGMSSEVIAALAATLDRLDREDTGRMAIVEGTGPLRVHVRPGGGLRRGRRSRAPSRRR